MEGSNMDALIAGFLAKDGNRCDEWGPLMMAMLCNGGFGYGNRGCGCGGYGGYGGYDGYKDYGYHDHRQHDKFIVDETNFGKILDSVDGHGFRQEEALCDIRKEISDKYCAVDKDVLMTQGLVKEKAGDLTHIVDKCCCDTNMHIDKVAYDELRVLDKGFCDTNRNVDRVDTDVKTAKLELDYLIEKKIAEVCTKLDKCCCDQNALIISKFAELDSRDKDKEISYLKDALLKKEIVDAIEKK